MRTRSLLTLCFLLVLCIGPYAVAGADPSPRPSDTGNQPAKPPTPPPAPTPPTTPPKPSSPPPGQPPATPAPSQSTPAPSAPPSSTPPPSSPANNTTSPAPSSSSAAPSPEPTPAPSPEPTPLPSSSSSSTTSSSESDSSGMGAGAIVGIVLACVGLVAIIGFFAYRHFRARREDAKNYDMEYGGPSPVLESSRAYDDKMYANLDMPKPSRQTTATATPTDDIVVMAKYATPSSPKFANNNNPPHLSPRPYDDEDDVADFTKSVNNFDQSRGPAAMASTEFSTSYRDGSYAESYAESYAGGHSYGGNSYGGAGSFMNSFDHGTLGRETFRDTLTEEQNATSKAPTAKPAATSNGLAGLDAGNNDSHWMDAMDEMRDTNDSYAMLEAGGSFNSRGSAMRFSNESDLRG